MENLIVIIIWLAAIVGTIAFRILGKVLSAGKTARTLTEVGKTGKSLFDLLSQGDVENLETLLKSAVKEKPRPPQQEKVVVPPPAPPVAERVKPGAPKIPPAQRRQTPAAKVPHPVRRLKRLKAKPEVSPTQVAPPLPLMESPLAAEEERLMVEPLRPKPEVPSLVFLRKGDPKVLREAIILYEILGPPKALRQMGRAGIQPLGAGFPFGR